MEHFFQALMIVDFYGMAPRCQIALGGTMYYYLELQYNTHNNTSCRNIWIAMYYDFVILYGNGQ